MDSIHYVIVLIYQCIFLDRNDDSKFYVLNKLSKATAQKANLKRKKKTLLILKCYKICLTTFESSLLRCLCILSFRSKALRKAWGRGVRFTALAGGLAYPSSAGGLVCELVIPPRQPRPLLMNARNPLCDISEEGKN